MSFSFARSRGLIVVRAVLQGPSANGTARLALDTGATRTLIRRAVLTTLGYDPSTTTVFTETATASGIERLPIVKLAAIAALGVTKTDIDLVCHDLPSGTDVDGLLGLDFLRGSVLTIDFRSGRLSLEA